MAIDENSSLDDIRAFFAQDRFATENGCRIIEARANHAVCEMDVTEHHLNAMGSVMGGALFTLADFAVAVAANLDGNPSVSVDCSMRFMAAPKQGTLRATCEADRAGRRMGFYTITVRDEAGTDVAILSATLHRAGTR